MLKKSISIILAVLMAVSVFAIVPITANADGDVYVVTGNFLQNKWQPEIDQDVMTYNGSGIYSITIPNVEPSADGIYNCKIVRFVDGDENNKVWIGKSGTDLNNSFYVIQKCDVNITYNSKNQITTISGSGIKLPDYNIDSVIAYGSGKDGFLNNISWNFAAEDNKMTMVSDGIYEITYENVKTNQEYLVKFAANGTYDINWGKPKGAEFINGAETSAVFDSDNIDFTPVSTEEYTAITLRLDIRNWDTETLKGATYTVTYTTAEPVETTEPQETTAPAETTEPQATTTSAETTEPQVTTAPAETTEPQSTTAPVVTAKTAANPIKVSVKAKTVKLSKLKKKAQKIKAITVKNAQGKVTYKITSASKKIKKLVKINKKGVITINKWKKAKKGTYKIKVKITAKGNASYNPASVSKTVKIKVK